MLMSSGGYAASSSGYVTRPRAREIGSTGYAGPTPRSSLIGRYVMATAEHREPCDSRGSCTVLGAPGGEIPPGDSSISTEFGRPRHGRITPASGMTADIPDQQLRAMRHQREADADEDHPTPAATPASMRPPACS